ncbi:MAG: DNA recombination protein RmuC [Ruminococcaceae bacterium]|nr:DNA recombination protein RmuC [Oscillospiraceae bacterium]
MSLEIILGFAALTLLAIAIVLLTVLLKRQSGDGQTRRLEERLDRMQRDLLEEQRASRKESNEAIQQSMQNMSQVLLTAQGNANTAVNENLESIRKAMVTQLSGIREENNRQLEQMRQTVDEKLQKTLNDRITQSFQLVNERLEQVYAGLGEMKTLASGVGDLKKVLSNVKTRGVLGEVQLGAILEQILSPEQYEANVKTRPGSTHYVEYAVKLPGADEGTVWLPIDAKFPVDAYAQLLEAYDTGDADAVKAAGSVLEQRIRAFARDIRDKYVAPPHTTDFGIMFLPIEGLYAEVVRRGLIETLQNEYHINIAGPTTMAALLNSLQMGFRTLAIQKRSGEVWKLLGAVKTEFDRFGDVVEAAQKRLEQAGDELDKLVGVRTRQIQRRLADVTSLPETEATALLDGGETSGE